MPDEHRYLLWTAWIVVASLGFSLGSACATPFAALGAVGALQLGVRRATAAVLLAWLGNQVIGFALLHYPLAANTFVWGAAIGLAGVASAIAAAGATSLISSLRWVRMGAVLVIAFAAYEGVLYATSLVLSSGDGAFAASIIARIFVINALAFVGLMVMHGLALRIGLLRMPRQQWAVTA